MLSMIEDGVLDARLAPSLRVHLDWIQYKTNFRDPVVIRRAADSGGRMLALAEIAIDLRQTSPERVSAELASAVRVLGDAPGANTQRQDIFVSDMDDYRKGFRGPGKLDGSLVTWVNGALLRAVGARAGYDVHFAPFPYRPGTKTTILYTTQRA